MAIFDILNVVAVRISRIKEEEEYFLKGAMKKLPDGPQLDQIQLTSLRKSELSELLQGAL